MSERLRIWLISWAQAAEGIVGILSVGYLRPGWNLAAARSLARWRGRRVIDGGR